MHPDTRLKSGPVGFWFLNDWIDAAEVDRQLSEFADKGFSGVVVHPRDGLKMPYLSRTWFDLVEQIIDKAGALNLEVWFYDEDPFPSGSAGGRVLALYPHLVGRTLEFTEMDVQPADGLIYQKLDGIKNLLRIYAFEVDSRGHRVQEFEDITAYAGLTGDQWHVTGRSEYSHGPFFAEKKSTPHWRAVVKGENWTLHWPTNDKAKRKLLVVSVRPRGDSRHGSYVDLLNPETTQRFIELTYQATYDAIGKDKFFKFIACFTDEPKLCYPYPWTDRLPELYRRAYGRDLFSDIPHLHLKINAFGYTVRLDYRTLLGKIWKETFFEPVATWCKANQIPFTGHVSPEEDPFTQALITPELSEMLLEMDWPGCDLITSLIGTPDFYPKLLGPKLVSSIAHQGSKERCVTECLAISGEGLTIDRMKKTIDWLAVCGMDTFVLHGQFYSLRGDRKREAPPSIFYEKPYWRYFGRFSGYMSKLTDLIRGSIPVRPIALLYPMAFFKAIPPVREELLDQVDRKDLAVAERCSDVMAALMSSALDFDLVAESFLTRASVEDGKLKVGDAVYECLIIPDVEMLDQASLQSIASLRTAGLKIESLSGRIHAIQNPSESLVLDAVDTETLIASCFKKYSDRMIHRGIGPVYVNTLTAGSTVKKIVWNPTDSPVEVKVAKTCRLSSLDDSIVDCDPDTDPKTCLLKLAPWQIVLLSQDDGSQSGKNSGLGYLKKIGQQIVQEDCTIEPQELNLLNLSDWQIQSQDGRKTAVQIPSASGQPAWRWAGQKVVALAEFMVCDPVDHLYLCWEDTRLTRSYSIFVNDVLIERSGQAADGYEKKADIAAWIRKGQNQITIQVDSVPAHKPVLADPFKLKGRFVVTLSGPVPQIGPMPQTLTVKPNRSWTEAGFPHYSGSMTYRSGFDLQKRDQVRYVIELPYADGDAVEILINSHPAGILAWRNAKIDVTDLVQTGRNTLTMIAANTAMNSTESVQQHSGLKGFPVLSLYETVNATPGLPDSVSAC